MKSSLVRNPDLSPFNVATEIRLPDFTQEQVLELLSRKRQEQPDWRDAPTLAERIYYWTAGQPYLAQLLCGSLRRPDASPEDVDAAARGCGDNDKNHFEGIRRHLREDPAMASYLCELIAGKRERMVSNDPGDLRTKLWLLGLVKERDGLCVVKNHIYEEAFRCSSYAYDVFISYRHKGAASYLPDYVSLFLQNKKKSVFLDNDSLDAEYFEPRILSAIEAAPNFIVILSPGCLDNCGQPGDWYAKEILHAIHLGRKIFMLEMEDFTLPNLATIQNFPPEIEDLLKREHRYALGTNRDEILKRISGQLRPI